jgi:hypothetical protein
MNWRCHTQNRQIIMVITMSYLKTWIEPILHNLSKHHHHFRKEAEEYLAVIRRQGGLKPLSRQSQPLQTKTNPYNKLINGSNKKEKISSAMNEPLYRKVCFICYIFPTHEYIFLIDFILHLCRSGWFVLVWR